MPEHRSTTHPTDSAVLFDLDGAFADTARDMAFAIETLPDVLDWLARSGSR